jgi:hypothetical protein
MWRTAWVPSEIHSGGLEISPRRHRGHREEPEETKNCFLCDLCVSVVKKDLYSYSKASTNEPRTAVSAGPSAAIQAAPRITGAILSGGVRTGPCLAA